MMWAYLRSHTQWTRCPAEQQSQNDRGSEKGADLLACSSWEGFTEILQEMGVPRESDMEKKWKNSPPKV